MTPESLTNLMTTVLARPGVTLFQSELDTVASILTGINDRMGGGKFDNSNNDMPLPFGVPPEASGPTPGEPSPQAQE
jgi:hypothetical protein